MMNKLIFVLTGPTAVGKTALSIDAAKKFNCEIISADSVQFYKGMNIGSAKIKPEEQCGVKHHLIDIMSPDEDMNISLFSDLCNKNIENIHKKGYNVLITGGSGLYIDSVVYDSYHFESAPQDENYRIYLNNLAKTHSKEYVHSILTNLDPLTAQRIHPNNLQRVIRALEIIKCSENGIPQKKKERLKDNVFYFILNISRDVLYDRINHRVDEMFKNGLVDEVKTLSDLGYSASNAMKAIGYKETLEYLNGILSLDDAKEKIKSNSRHYAKRQLTWFRGNKDVIWINIEEYDSNEKILEYMERKIWQTDSK